MKKILISLSCCLFISSTFAGWDFKDQFSAEEINQKKNEIRILMGNARQAYPDQDSLINTLIQDCKMRSNDDLLRVVCEDLYNPLIPRNSAPTIPEDSPFWKVQHQDMYTYDGAVDVACIRKGNDVFENFSKRDEKFIDENYECHRNARKLPIGLSTERKLCVAPEKGSTEYQCAMIKSFLIY